MNDENKNSITYDENWKSVSEAEYPTFVDYESETDEEEITTNKAPKKNKDAPRQLLVTIQFIVCIVLSLVALVIKSIGGDIYSTVRECYYNNLNNTAIFNDDITDFDTYKLFNSSSQEESSKDEVEN